MIEEKNVCFIITEMSRFENFIQLIIKFYEKYLNGQNFYPHPSFFLHSIIAETQFLFKFIDKEIRKKLIDFLFSKL